MLNKLTTNYTYFLREEAHFKYLWDVKPADNKLLFLTQINPIMLFNISIKSLKIAVS